MTERDEFTALCKKLYGSQRKASRELQIPLSTIGSWGATAPMHQGVLRLMRRLDKAEREAMLYREIRERIA